MNDLNLKINLYLWNFGFIELNDKYSIFEFRPYYPMGSVIRPNNPKTSSLFYFYLPNILYQIKHIPFESIKTIAWRNLQSTQFKIASCIFLNPQNHIIKGNNLFYEQYDPIIMPILKSMLEIVENSLLYGSQDCAVAITTKSNFRGTGKKYLLVTISDFGAGPNEKLLREFNRKLNLNVLEKKVLALQPNDHSLKAKKLRALYRSAQRSAEYKQIHEVLKSTRSSTRRNEISMILSVLLYRRTESGYGIFDVFRFSCFKQARMYLRVGNTRVEILGDIIPHDLMMNLQTRKVLSEFEIKELIKYIKANTSSSDSNIIIPGMQVDIALPVIEG
jgi:hypothetical protein